MTRSRTALTVCLLGAGLFPGDARAQDPNAAAIQAQRDLARLHASAPSITASPYTEQGRRSFGQQYSDYTRQRAEFDWKHRQLTHDLEGLNETLHQGGQKTYSVPDLPADSHSDPVFEEFLQQASDSELQDSRTQIGDAAIAASRGLKPPDPPKDWQDEAQVEKYRKDLFAYGEREDLEDQLTDAYNRIVSELSDRGHKVLDRLRRGGLFDRLLSRLRLSKQVGALGVLSGIGSPEREVRPQLEAVSVDPPPLPEVDPHQPRNVEPHQLRPGETLWHLAQAKGGPSVPQLMRQNGIMPGEQNQLTPGRTVRVPRGPGSRRPVLFVDQHGSLSHLISNSDRPSTITELYGITIGELARANHGRAWRDFKVGDQVKLPLHANINADVDLMRSTRGRSRTGRIHGPILPE